jgi:BioD-like phosphotransacetylase family protein
MIKKHMLIFALTLSVAAVFAQDIAAERAAELTNEMAQILSLSEADKAKVYEIQLNRFQAAMEIRTKYVDDADARKAALRKVYDKLHGKLKGTIGSEKMKAWGNYKRNY